MILPADIPGFLLVIEGIDGTGKSTQAGLLEQRMTECGLRVLRTREPTNGRWGQMLRDSATTGRLSIEEEVEAFINDRREHVETKIMPALRDGKVVIIDRYYFSTAAYQGARGLDPQELMRRNEEFAPEPHLLVLLDLEVSEGHGRIQTRGDQANHFEQTESLKRAREIFLSIDKPYLHKINARRDPSDVCKEIVREFSRRYSERIAQLNPRTNQQVNAALQRLTVD